MTCKNIMDMLTLFLLLPCEIGVIWVNFLKIKGKVECFLNAWLLGFVTMLAAGQLILVPMIAAEQTLTNAILLWKILLTILSVYALFVMLKWSNVGSTYEVKSDSTFHFNGKIPKDNRRIWIIVFGCIAAIMIFMQAFILANYQHIDDDDARFVAEEVSAYVHNTMLRDDPITVDFMYWDLGEVRKDLTSPWTMYVAMNCRISGIHPAIYSHTFFPFFMIFICYIVYLQIGRLLFKKDMEKVFLFLIVLSVLNIWGYTSTHTLASMILLRIWQGKAIVAGFIIPLLFYILYHVLENKDELRWVASLYAVSFAGSLLSGIGIIVVPVMLALYGVVDFIYYKNWKKTLAVWLAVVPCGIYFIYYLVGPY